MFVDQKVKIKKELDASYDKLLKQSIKKKHV